MEMVHGPTISIRMYADRSLGVDDYVYVGSNSVYGLGVAISQGGGTFGTYLYYAFPNSCNRVGVVFADMTGDGTMEGDYYEMQMPC